jgi:sn-glycerol 3-phosphate transport system substrate-binding protein
MLLKAVIRALAGAAVAIASVLALAQAPVEVSFYYPVAVGGPITKIIDGLAADFEKENPGIKLKPIYSGSYQESITKALTAVKSGDPPVTSILLSTDMFTLIDEDAIVPFDDLIKTPDDQAAPEFLPGLHGKWPDRRQTWGIPFQRRRSSSINKEAFGAGRSPTRTDQLEEQVERRKLASAMTGKVDGGDQIPSSGFPYWLFRRSPSGGTNRRQRRHADLLRPARVIEGLTY